MADRPILFRGEMVRALLDGRKTQTRRPAFGIRKTRNPAIAESPTYRAPTVSQRIGVGDRLWVRETWCAHSLYVHLPPRDVPANKVFYQADEAYAPSGVVWRPVIHMPRWASRLTLAVMAVRVEPLQAISEQDAYAEGVTTTWRDGTPIQHDFTGGVCIEAYRELYERIHGNGAWDANPEVVVITFTVHKANIDALAKQADPAHV